LRFAADVLRALVVVRLRELDELVFFLDVLAAFLFLAMAPPAGRS
jgi:hypothetical protein